MCKFYFKKEFLKNTLYVNISIGFAYALHQIDFTLSAQENYASSVLLRGSLTHYTTCRSHICQVQ